MIKLLLKLNVIQEKIINKNSRFEIRKIKRLNPYNPLTYIIILLCFMIGILLFGFVGFWQQVDLKDLKFKYR